MTDSRPLLMIPGPVELSPAVLAAAAEPPLGHLDPLFVARFGAALGAMRRVWRAGASSVPFVAAGGGTLAMESAATNLISPGERALVVVTGTFGDRMVEMLKRRGAEVVTVSAPPGEVPSLEAVESAFDRAHLDRRPFKALFATHVDTSTAVRVEVEPLARMAGERGALSVFDGVCATGGERFEMECWGADLYFTASQKALGAPPGLALWVASKRALEARRTLAVPPPLTLDWDAWRPVMEGYESGKPRYFSTPPTSLVCALAQALNEISNLETDTAAGGVTAAAGERTESLADSWHRHARAARALNAAWSALGLATIPLRAEISAHTLSALRFPTGIGNELLGRIREHGVAVAGSLHKELLGAYFRVGQMGYVTRTADPLLLTVAAVAAGLGGDYLLRLPAARTAFEEAWAAAD